jgi:hypothetical protein
MTPQERQLIGDLFDRLAKLEQSPRDGNAERAIAEGLSRAPNALYPLVQTVLVQDEALKRAEARIRELSGDDGAEQTGGGFLDNMRQAFGGGRATSVPSVRASANAPDPRWNTGSVIPPQAGTPLPPQAGVPAASQPHGGSFLGTAAATAAGVIGGSLLFNSLGGLFGNHNSGSAFGNTGPGASPWGDNTAGSGANSNLARDAGLNDIGSGMGEADHRASLFDAPADDGGDIGGGFGGDFGGDSGGDSA